MKNRIYFLIVLLWSSIALLAQAPNISYPAGTYTFDTGTIITPLIPTNTGGVVPATIYGQVSTLGGEGPAVSFNNPTGVAVDSAGNVYVADRMNNKIRKITPLGIVTTFAGSGVAGSADGTIAAASFSGPSGVAVDSVGNLYVADSGNNKIRKITPAGVVTTFAGSGDFGSAGGTGTAASFYNPTGVAVDSAGNVYVTDSGNAEIRKITLAGVVTTLAGSGSVGSSDGTGTAASFNSPSGVTIDQSGNVYVADLGNNKIRKITPAGVVTTLAGSGTAGSADGTGTAASFNRPSSVAVDSAGNVFVADYLNAEIRKITSAGLVTTFTGNGTFGSVDGTGSAARFAPKGVSVDSAGNVYVADTSNKIRKVTPSGVVTTLAGSGAAGATDGTVTAASFNSPSGVAVDLAGNVYVADTENNRIRKITPAGVVTTLAGSGSVGAADGIGTAASFYSPSSVTVDSAGNVYVADTWNNKIRKITPAGVVTTLAGNSIGLGGSADGTGTAASFEHPTGVAVDSAGNVYVAENSNKIRKITPAGVVTTLAGNRYVGSADGTGTAASFYYPKGVAVDSAGNVYVADTRNNKIRKITPAGVVTTLQEMAQSAQQMVQVQQLVFIILQVWRLIRQAM